LLSLPDLQNSVSFIRKHGYGIIANLFCSAELFATSEELSSVEVKRSRAGARHVLSLPSISKIAHRNELLAIARGVLGSNALPFRATYFDKSPNSNWLVAWHQDTALPLTAKREIPGWGPWSTKDGVIYAHAPAAALEQVLALRVHLDDSTPTNGPLRVIPGTNRFGVLTDAEIQERAGNSYAVVCTVPTGGAIAMRPLLIHASSKSESELPRRVLHIEYASSRRIGSELELALA
jgi:ectoine hydroxylase-related dioxygenase (phytanoyl-CoA dioxygenase family)